MLANLVAKKYTCRICGSVDFASQPDRRLHETQCKKRKVEAERARDFAYEGQPNQIMQVAERFRVATVESHKCEGTYQTFSEAIEAHGK